MHSDANISINGPCECACDHPQQAIAQLMQLNRHRLLAMGLTLKAAVAASPSARMTDPSVSRLRLMVLPCSQHNCSLFVLHAA